MFQVRVVISIDGVSKKYIVRQFEAKVPGGDVETFFQVAYGDKLRAFDTARAAKIAIASHALNI